MWIRLYSLLWALALPFVIARLLFRGLREPGYLEDMPGRFGFGRPGRPGTLWIHAVSAGEVQAAVPMVKRLARRHADAPLLVTCSTATGRARARELLGATVDLAWLPFDLPVCVDAFLERRRPALLVLLETELWPVLVARCAARGIPVVLANARLSARSAQGYARLSRIAGPMIARLDRILCQDAGTAERFRGLGARAGTIAVTGSLKFEPEVPADLMRRVSALRARLAGARADAFVVVAGSTHAGEEQALLGAFVPVLERDARWRLVLAPRRPERFDAVARLCRRSFRDSARASDADAPVASRVLLWDRMGDLFALYGAADAAFVGGSLVPAGGHNPIEAGWHGTPVVTGPHGENFAAVNGRLAAAGGLVAVDDAAGAVAVLESWCGDREECARRGAAARRAVEAGGGALSATAAALDAVLQFEP